MNPTINNEELKAKLQADFDDLVKKICNAINCSRPGKIIADSEEPVRDANAEFRESAYQKAIDLLQDKHLQEDFSPSADSADDAMG